MGSQGGPVDPAVMMQQLQSATDTAVQIARQSTVNMEALIWHQTEQQAQRTGDAVLQGKDLVRILRQPQRFEASTREQELSGWRQWSWELEQWLGAIDPAYIDELEIVKAERNFMEIATMGEHTQKRSQILFGSGRSFA